MREYSDMTEDRESSRTREAACWIVKLDPAARSRLTPTDSHAWTEWSRDGQNKAAFEKLVALGRAVKGSAGLPWPTAAELRADKRSADLVMDSRWDVTTRRFGSHRLSSSAPVWLGRLVAGLAVSAMMAWAALTINSRWLHHGPRLKELKQSYSTSTGQQTNVVLSDGSTVVLGASTSISVRYSAGERAVILNYGEALFRVSHNAIRPFRVLALNGSITAVGTQFNVRCLGEGTRVIVTVAEGTVIVSPQEALARQTLARVFHPMGSAQWTPFRLEHGQEVMYEARGTSEVQSADAELVTAWMRGTMVYNRRPLSEVIDDVQRYSQRHITLDEGVGELLYSGTIGQRNVDAWIHALPEIFTVEVVDTGTGHIIIRQRTRAQHLQSDGINN